MIRCLDITAHQISDKDGGKQWFFTVDNVGGEDKNPKQTSGTTFRELRTALAQMVREDNRTFEGLAGKETPILEFKLPSQAVELVENLRVSDFLAFLDLARYALVPGKC